ncbi:MAG: nuclear transport factor 2 family protein [Solirubrobacterales bacterium]
MSRENVATVRMLLDAFDQRDHERAFEFYDPEIEWDATGIEALGLDIAGKYRGHDGVRTYWRRWLGAWSDLEFEIEDVLDAGDDVVALIRNQRQWGRHSGIRTEFPDYGLVFTFRDGKVVRWRSFPDQDAALEAVGLTR